MATLEVTASQAKQSRLFRLSKGVAAAALSIDNKFREKYGDPVVVQRRVKGKLQRVFAPSSPYRTAMITLTYSRDGLWDASQIAGLVKHYREWFKRNGGGESFHYVWVMELTEIGRPHYHLVAWFPKGVVPPLPDQQGWWKFGMTQAIFASSPVGYIVKYASKQESKSGHHLPKGARLWGYGGLRMDERAGVAFSLAPRWLKSLVHHESHVVKRVYHRVVNAIRYAPDFVHEYVIRRSGWYVKSGYGKGNWFFSPYDFEGFGDNGVVLRHRGNVEMLTDDGDVFLIPCKG